MTQPQNTTKGWAGRAGYVDAQFVKDHLRDQAQSVYYVAGPPRFVSTLEEVLAAAGVKERAIRSDVFTGY